MHSSSERITAIDTALVPSAHRCASADAAGSSSSARQHLLDQATASRFRGVDELTDEAPVERLGDADDAWEEPTRVRLGREAAAAEHEAVARLLARQPHVGGEGHGRADADGRAVDRRDDRLLARVHPERDDTAGVAVLVDRGPALRLDVEGRRPAAEIHPGAERTPAAGDDDRAHRVVGVGLVERVAELVAHARGERVRADPAGRA